MKGIILAGGTGTRLHPLTRVTNKHLLPVGEHPMIMHAISKLVAADIKNIMIITGTEHMGDMISLLGSGSEWGCELTYRVQDQANGIAGALALTESFIGTDKCIVILGDNIFEDSIAQYVSQFNKSKAKCFLLLKRVSDPERYGVALIKEGRLIKAVEKPKSWISDLCITGIYMYDASVFEKLRNLKISDRGEYEITEVNHAYIEEGEIEFNELSGWWTDAGTHHSYYLANALVRSAK